MKIVILSRSRHSYSTRRLREACLVRGHTVRVLDTMRFSMAVERGNPRLLYRDKPLSRYDAVIPRIGASITFYGTAVVRQFEQMGVFTLSSSHAISVSRDKLRALQVLSRHTIGIPPTAFVRDRQSVMAAIERLGGAPVIVKVLEGTQGVGVILAETSEVAAAIIETLQGAKQNVLIQRFPRAASTAATSTAAGAPRRCGSTPSTSGRRSTRRRSWACAWPAWTCWSRRTGRR
jgi:ribosomal protein S6--L-glutamate ligase